MDVVRDTPSLFMSFWERRVENEGLTQHLCGQGPATEGLGSFCCARREWGEPCGVVAGQCLCPGTRTWQSPDLSWDITVLPSKKTHFCLLLFIVAVGCVSDTRQPSPLPSPLALHWETPPESCLQRV